MKYSDIYNRIADTYFSPKHINHKQKQLGVKKNSQFTQFFFVSIISVFLISFVFLLIFSQRSHINAQKKSLSILGNILPLRLEYDFSQSSEKIKIIALDLPLINLSDYDMLEFSLRGDKTKGFNSLIKIELESKRREKKDFYLRGVQSNWKIFKFPLRELIPLNSFSELSRISFIVEDWNAQNEKGRIFIDKIVFSKEG
ncbi:MAG: hypothetical protein AB1629_06460 [Candidatus Omnitrophota bacterium]